MARKSPAEIIARFCEHGRFDGEAAVAALDKAGYVIITKADRRVLERARSKGNGQSTQGPRTGRISVR